MKGMVIKMANIKPFTGYRYDPKKIPDPGKVMVPPYDTISPDEQEEYYNANEYNIIRAAKGKADPLDTPANNSYTRANEFLNGLIEKNILIRDDSPAFYLYEQQVKYNNTTFVNHGIVALLELTELDGHEVMTCELPSLQTTEDRYNLLSHCNANIDMINCMYIDPEKGISSIENSLEEQKPDMEFITAEKVIETNTMHRIWVIKDKRTINHITKLMKNKTFFITDGHNRYATALQYKKYCAANDKNYSPDSDCNFIMALCSNAFGNRMVQLPVHRMINSSKKFNEDFFIACAQDYFKVEKIIVDTVVDDFTETMKKQIATVRMDTRFALYCGGNSFYRLTLLDRKKVKELLPDKPAALCALDVTVFNKLILEDILNITEDKYEDYVSYTKRSTKGVNAVENGDASCLFVLNPVKAEQIREVALSGEVMPDRSIYIFPKPATGVIIYKFEK